MLSPPLELALAAVPLLSGHRGPLWAPSVAGAVAGVSALWEEPLPWPSCRWVSQLIHFALPPPSGPMAAFHFHLSLLLMHALEGYVEVLVGEVEKDDGMSEQPFWLRKPRVAQQGVREHPGPPGARSGEARRAGGPSPNPLQSARGLRAAPREDTMELHPPSDLEDTLPLGEQATPAARRQLGRTTGAGEGADPTEEAQGAGTHLGRPVLGARERYRSQEGCLSAHDARAPHTLLHCRRAPHQRANHRGEGAGSPPRGVRGRHPSRQLPGPPRDGQLLHLPAKLMRSRHRSGSAQQPSRPRAAGLCEMAGLTHSS